MKIYKITNSINSKVYIGKTINSIEDRLKQHIAKSIVCFDNNKFYNALRKHGYENFKTEEIETVDTLEELNQREIYWIEKYDSFNNGYNGTIGGDGGINEASIESCSIPVICVNTNKRYKNSREAGRDLNISYKGIFKVCTGARSSIHGYVFEYDNCNIYSEEIMHYKELRSEIKEIKYNKVIDLETNTLYDSLRAAHKDTNISLYTINKHCKKQVQDETIRFQYSNINKSLIIGDWHCKVANLSESEKLMEWVIKIAEEHNIDSIVFMGDQFDTHSIIRLEVLCFWTKWFRRLSVMCPIYVLVGNHDMNGNKELTASEINSLSVFTAHIQNKSDVYYNIHIIDRPTEIEGIAFMPYYHDKDLFISDVTDLYKYNNCKNILFAHQNFTQDLFGDLIDPDLIPQKNIISGHVHSNKLSKGKVFYAGTPMWHTSIDANEEKGVWLVEFNADKTIKNNTFLPTKEVVTPMYRVTIKEGEEIPVLQENAKTAYELIGQSTWIATMKKKLKGKGSIKAVPMDRKHVKVDSSKLLNLNDFANINFKPLAGVTIEDITCYIGRIDGI